MTQLRDRYPIRVHGSWIGSLGLWILIATVAVSSAAAGGEDPERRPRPVPGSELPGPPRSAVPVKDTDDLVFEKAPFNQVKPPPAQLHGNRSRDPGLSLVSPFLPSNVNVSNLVGNESEVSIAINPTNPLNMVIVGHSPAAVAMNTFFTLDGGQTWTLVALGAAADGQANCLRTDPTVAFDANGTVYAGYFTFNCTATTTRILFVARSTNGGQTYPQITAAVTDPTGGLDKEILGTGRDPVNAGQQNVYVAYRLDVGADAQIHLTASFNGGATFPSDVIINDDSIAGNDFSSFGMPAVGPNGELYVVWDDFSNNPAFSQIMVDVSFDAGANWGTDVQIATTGVTRNNANGLPASGRYTIPAQPDRGILAVPSIAVDRTGGPNNGRIYVTYTAVGGGGVFDTNVVLQFSDDNGANWSAPVTVNDDGGTRSQFHPWVAVDNCGASLGRVVVTWYDARNDANNRLVQNFLGVSENGGAFFQPNVQVSAGQSDQSTANPARFNPNNYLEYIGVDVCNSVACTVWADNSTNAGDLDFFSDCVPITTADLSVTKSDVPDPVTTGGTLTYILSVTNTGPDPATVVSLADVLPPSGFFFTSASPGCAQAAGTVTCSLGNLAVGQTSTRTITGTIDCSLANGTVLVNTASAASRAVDPDPTDSADTEMTTVSNPPPVVTCPANVSHPNDPGLCSAVVSYPPPTVTDNCPGATATCAPASGSTFPVGATSVACTASDSGGATSTCAFAVTVVDVEPPVISSVAASPAVLWPPNHRMVPVSFNVAVTDNCDAAPLCHVVSISSNEPVDGVGDGHTTPDWLITGALTADIRAERSGRGNGRIYANTLACTDSGGNSSSGNTFVTVPHDQR